MTHTCHAGQTISSTPRTVEWLAGELIVSSHIIESFRLIFQRPALALLLLLTIGSIDWTPSLPAAGAPDESLFLIEKYRN
jgi:hypothetical protein